MVFTLSFNIAVSRFILQHWQWQSVGYGPVRDVKLCFRTSNLTGCQRSAVLLPHFRSVLTAKDLKFCFHTSVLPWLPKIWSSASALSLLPKIWSSTSALSFRLRTSLLPWLQKICSFTFQVCLHSQRCERTSALPAKVLPPQFRCRFILCISTQFRVVLHEGLALQRDEASLFASKNQNHLIHT